MISETAIVAASSEVVSCELADGAALLDLQKNIYYGINPVGTEVWRLAQANVTVSEMVKSIREKFEVGDADVLADLAVMLRDLESAKLISISDAPAD